MPHERPEDEPIDDEPIEDSVVALPLVESGHAQVRRARQRYGLAGAALAGAMVALRDVLEKPKDDAAVVVEAPSDPVDLDGAGITVTLDGRAAAAVAPQHRPVSDPEAARAFTSRVLRRNRRKT